MTVSLFKYTLTPLKEVYILGEVEKNNRLRSAIFKSTLYSVRKID